MLGKKKVSAVALPLSAAKNGQPCAPITDLVKAGMNVALGTDGAIQAGNLDMFEVMRGAAMSVRASKGDPSALPSSAALMMATFCGAQAQGRAQECGMLKEGMDADLVLVDFTAPHLMPCHNVLTGLVYAAKGGRCSHDHGPGQHSLPERPLPHHRPEHRGGGADNLRHPQALHKGGK